MVVRESLWRKSLSFDLSAEQNEEDPAPHAQELYEYDSSLFSFDDSYESSVISIYEAIGRDLERIAEPLDGLDVHASEKNSVSSGMEDQQSIVSELDHLSDAEDSVHEELKKVDCIWEDLRLIRDADSLANLLLLDFSNELSRADKDHAQTKKAESDFRSTSTSSIAQHNASLESQKNSEQMSPTEAKMQLPKDCFKEHDSLKLTSVASNPSINVSDQDISSLANAEMIYRVIQVPTMFSIQDSLAGDAYPINRVVRVPMIILCPLGSGKE
jgi:hypothetical protein